jgi:RNA polymerase sigma-70 factor (ECF subfamily)
MMTDDELLRSWSERGDRTALDELLGRHRDEGLRAARRILRNEADANDAVQTAFVSAIEKLGTLREGARFPAWLRRIVVNSALEMRRTRSRKPPGAVLSPSPDERWSTEDFEILRKALDELPDDYRQPIVLHYCDGRSYEEVAEILDCPRGTVGTNIHRGMERLRVSLKGAVADSAATMLCLLDGLPGPGDSAFASAPDNFA